MTNTSRVAAIMTALITVQAAGLVWFANGHLLRALGRWLGFTTAHSPFSAWAAALGIALGYVAASMMNLREIRQRLFTINTLKLLAIAFALVTGTFEEIFFRKWIMTWAATQGWTAAMQVVFSGLVFGASHAIWGLFGGNSRALFSSMAFTTGLGLALAGLYVFANRQIAPCAWSHILINLILEPWLLLAVLNLRSRQSDRDGARIV